MKVGPGGGGGGRPPYPSRRATAGKNAPATIESRNGHDEALAPPSRGSPRDGPPSDPPAAANRPKGMFSRARGEASVTVETAEGIEALPPSFERTAATAERASITVETPDGIEAIPVETTGLSPSPSGPSAEWRRRAVGRIASIRGTEPAAPTGGCAVDARDDDEGGLGLADRGRTLSMHGAFLASLEDELARDAAALIRESRVASDRMIRTLSAQHGDFFASLEGELARDAAALIRGVEPKADCSGLILRDGPATAAGDGVSPQGSSVTATRANVADEPTCKRDEVLRGSAEPARDGIDSSAEGPTLTDSEESSLFITTREGSFVSALTTRDDMFNSAIGCGTTGDLFGVAARTLLCRNGTHDSAGDHNDPISSYLHVLDGVI